VYVVPDALLTPSKFDVKAALGFNVLVANTLIDDKVFDVKLVALNVVVLITDVLRDVAVNDIVFKDKLLILVALNVGATIVPSCLTVAAAVPSIRIYP
jgi:hypothetical protein